MLEPDVKMFQECMEACARAALAANGILASPESVGADAGDRNPQIAAFIGFGGEQIRGTLMMAAPLALMRGAYRLPGADGGTPTDDDILDWSGEIVNQTLGRMTNTLVARGIVLVASIPKAIQVDRLWVSRTTHTSVCGLNLRNEGGVLGVWLNAVVSPGVALFALPKVEATSMTEGDLLLF